MTAADQEDSPRKKRSGCLRWSFRVILLFLVLIALLAMAAGGALLVAKQHVQRQGIAGEPVTVEIPKGATGADVARIMAENGLVEHELFFRLALRMDQNDKGLQAGTYDLAKGLSPMQLLGIIHEGPDISFDPSKVPADLKVTIPEGLTISQMADLFDDPGAFLDAVKNPQLIARVNPGGTSLEGYLMPSTYFFEKKPSEAMVVETMVEQFEKDWAKLSAAYPEGLSRLPHEILTVASLVEEEARVDSERPIIAAIIYNRIAQGMPLDLDSTLQYALGKYGQRMLNQDKEVASPYNTYRNAGLPPGPISNPGPQCIAAALDPADVDFLYFVSNADGKTHTFSRTLEEHNQAVARFRREIAEQRRALQERKP